MQHKKLSTWSGYVSERVYRAFRELDPAAVAVVRKALGGKQRFVGLQVGYLLGTLSSYGESDAHSQLKRLVDAYNESRKE